MHGWEGWETAGFHTQVLDMKHRHWKLCVLAVGTVVDFGGEPTSVAEPRQVHPLRNVILIQWLSHHTFGSIWMPSNGMAKWMWSPPAIPVWPLVSMTWPRLTISPSCTAVWLRWP